MNNRPQDDKQTAKPYSVRTKRSGGKEFIHVYVPSRVRKDGTQDYAWVPVDAESECEEMRKILRDTTQLPAWKIAYLEELYSEFRETENARKRGDISYSIWQDELRDSKQYVTFSIDEEVCDLRMMLADAFSELPTHVREWIWMKLVEGLTFVEIARLEKPGASVQEVKTAADTISKAVRRGLQKVKEKLS